MTAFCPSARRCAVFAWLVICALVLLQACDSAEPGASKAADIRALEELHVKASEVNNAGDLEGWLALFPEGAIIMPPDHPEVSTREGLREWKKAIQEKGTVNITIKPVEIEVADDWAYSRIAITGTGTPKDGGEVHQFDEKELAIWRRQPDGTWKVWRLIGNGNRPQTAESSDSQPAT